MKVSDYLRARKDAFQHAFHGIAVCYHGEPHSKIHLLFTILVLSAGVLLRVDKIEWALLILCIGLVWGTELMNTAVEKTIDFHTQEFHPLAKKAKDLAAGAVFVSALTASIIGLIIFLPKIIHIFHYSF